MKRTENVKLLSDLNWDTVKSRRDTAKLVLYYKIMNASAPAYLTNLLPETNIPERYNFRRRDRTKHIKTRLKMYELSTVKCWNNLPFNVVSSRSVIAFKKQLFELKLGSRNDVLVFKSNFLQFATGYYSIQFKKSYVSPSLIEYPLREGPHSSLYI